MVTGRLKHHAELGALAILIVAGGWDIAALAYLILMIALAVASAALLDGLLEAASNPDKRGSDPLLYVSNPWLVIALAALTVMVAPLLIVSEFAPPLMIGIFALFFAYFGAIPTRDFLYVRRTIPREDLHLGLDPSLHLP